MKVLIKGKIPEKVQFNLICKNCNTVIEVDPEDLRNQKYTSRQYIDCPTCNKNICDTSENRLEANNFLAKERKNSSCDMREYSTGYQESYNPPRSGGPTGPLPPPELPHYTNFVKALIFSRKNINWQ